MTRLMRWNELDPNRVEAAELLLNVWESHIRGDENVDRIAAMNMLNKASAYLIWGDHYDTMAIPEGMQ
jgi:hypothetical protein